MRSIWFGHLGLWSRQWASREVSEAQITRVSEAPLEFFILKPCRGVLGFTAMSNSADSGWEKLKRNCLKRIRKLKDWPGSLENQAGYRTGTKPLEPEEQPGHTQTRPGRVPWSRLWKWQTAPLPSWMLDAVAGLIALAVFSPWLSSETGCSCHSWSHRTHYLFSPHPLPRALESRLEAGRSNWPRWVSCSCQDSPSTRAHRVGRSPRMHSRRMDCPKQTIHGAKTGSSSYFRKLF